MIKLKDNEYVLKKNRINVYKKTSESKKSFIEVSKYEFKKVLTHGSLITSFGKKIIIYNENEYRIFEKE